MLPKQDTDIRTRPIANHHILSAREVATYLQVSRITIYRLVERGGLPGQKVGAQWRFTRTAVDAWVWGETRSPGAA
jgi:excisionase family DNA binding protein